MKANRIATARGDTRIFQWLVDKAGANPNPQSKNLLLECAIQSGIPAKTMIDMGVDPLHRS